MSEQKMVMINDFLTEEQIKKAFELYPDARAIADQVIKPNMAEINQKLGQENDELYLAYLIVHVFNESISDKTIDADHNIN